MKNRKKRKETGSVLEVKSYVGSNWMKKCCLNFHNALYVVHILQPCHLCRLTLDIDWLRCSIKILYKVVEKEFAYTKTRIKLKKKNCTLNQNLHQIAFQHIPLICINQENSSIEFEQKTNAAILQYSLS